VLDRGGGRDERRQRRTSRFDHLGGARATAGACTCTCTCTCTCHMSMCMCMCMHMCIMCMHMSSSSLLLLFLYFFSPSSSSLLCFSPCVGSFGLVWFGLGIMFYFSFCFVLFCFVLFCVMAKAHIPSTTLAQVPAQARVRVYSGYSKESSFARMG
jgi:hypothetical protein